MVLLYHDIDDISIMLSYCPAIIVADFNLVVSSMYSAAISWHRHYSSDCETPRWREGREWGRVEGEGRDSRIELLKSVSKTPCVEFVVQICFDLSLLLLPLNSMCYRHWPDSGQFFCVKWPLPKAGWCLNTDLSVAQAAERFSVHVCLPRCMIAHSRCVSVLQV